MARTLSQARIGVCPLTDIPKFQRNIPVKIFEYWACGLPVVASDLPPIRPFFKSAARRPALPRRRCRRARQRTRDLLANPAHARKMGARGREAVEPRYNNRSEVLKLRRLVKESPLDSPSAQAPTGAVHMLEPFLRANFSRFQSFYDLFPSPARNVVTSARGWLLTQLRYSAETLRSWTPFARTKIGRRRRSSSSNSAPYAARYATQYTSCLFTRTTLM